MWKSDNWKQYSLIDSSGGERLERWGDVTVIRPDPQAVWNSKRTNPLWKKADARYIRSNSGGGQWEFYKKLPESWTIKQDGLQFKIKPMNFKHMGLFPEQLTNWEWFSKLIKESNREINVLNLFAYTGGATVACAKAGAKVCHVDASKGMVAHAKENAELSGLKEHPIRYIVDDCVKFVNREIRRGNRYDAIIMDPPSYGRGPGGEVWKIETELYNLVTLCSQVLSDRPLFFLLNSYTTGLSGYTMENVLRLILGEKFDGEFTSDEIGIPTKDSGIVLPCGCSARFCGR
ncbi:MAG: class I SAM-dependent methyltransferase [Clostridia bacterium]|nr:class I SAM-dependent methyltransferase [Clostridia bacterium]